MAEYNSNTYDDEHQESIHNVSPSKVIKSFETRPTSIRTNLSESFQGINGSFARIHPDPPRHQTLYSSHYSVPIIEESVPLRRSDLAFESRRPGTPALTECDLIVDDDNPSIYDTPVCGLRRHENGTSYSRQEYNYGRDGSGYGAASRDSRLEYPPTAAPPTSPSQLYTFLLQRTLRSQEQPLVEPRQQVYIPDHVEVSNIFPSRNIHVPDYNYDIHERERFYRHHTNGRRYEHLSHVNRRYINQNCIRLPYSMVRLKDTGDSKETNGFAEDGEGNHDCHDLRHEPGQTSDEATSLPMHQNGTSDRSRLDATEASGLTTMSTSIYQGEWPMHRALWMSGPSSIGEKDPLDGFGADDTESIMSFSSSTATSSRRPLSHQFGTKVEMVYSLLSMLGSCSKEDMSRTLLEMSANQDSCIAMRQSGCLPLLIQLLHGSDRDQVLLEQKSSEEVQQAVREARRRASRALHNIVHAHPDDRRGRREARVLRLLEQIRDYSDYLRDIDSGVVNLSHNENLDMHPGPAIAALMKLSFDEEHRHAMCQLGGLQAIAELIQADHEVHGNTSDQFCVTVRRYAGMALTNLTFGDGTNKALLCSMKPFMQALVAQLQSPSEDLRQVTASVLRNLSWRADSTSKQILREVGVVTKLTEAAMQASKESTLKSILSALWNLSAHCSMNKAEICSIDGALEFLVSTLTYKSASKTLSIVENGGGILRNVSSHIAVREDYRAVLRRQNCLQTLLSHLKSPSLTVVSNACGTLWNLSARCQQDQKALWEMGAVGMLRNLVHSKHKMISMGSSAALKNLLAARPPGMDLNITPVENGHHMNGSTPNVPSLLVRKQRALEADLDQNLSETCENIDSPKTSPTPHSDTIKKFIYETNGLNCIEQRPQYLSYLPGRMYHSINGQVGSPIHVPRSESKDSLGSTRSEPPHYKAQRERFRIFINNTRPLDSRTVQERAAEWKEKTNLDSESNSNIVLQLFRHLQNGTSGDSPKSPQSPSHQQPSRPNSLLPTKMGVWNVKSNKLIQQPRQNDMDLPQSENVNHLSLNGFAVDRMDSIETRDGADTNFLNFPGNKRTIPKDSLTVNLHSETNEVNPEVKHNNFDAHKEPEEHTRGNVILRRKKLGDALLSSSTHTKDSVSSENSTDHTPLIVSRCSSLSSLTSCFQHSARSSWVSDVSQRTSAVISPADIPESPGYCTTEDKQCISEFTDKAPDGDIPGLVRPRPAWPNSISSLTSTDSLPSSMKRMSSGSDVFMNSSDMPPPCSMTDQSEISEIMESPISLKTPPTRPQNTPVSPEKELCVDSKSSPEEQDIQVQHISEHDLDTAQVILGMPNNTSDGYRNNSILHTKTNNLTASVSITRSGIPIKSSNILTQSVSNISRSTHQESPSYQHRQPGKFSTYNNVNDSSSVPICDDNDNVLFNSETTVSAVKDFESKCLNVCKRYPALSHKSSFSETRNRDEMNSSLNQSYPSPRTCAEQRERFSLYKMTASGGGGTSKTAIPQMIRPWSIRTDIEQSSRQQQQQSASASKSNLLTQAKQPMAAEETTSSAEENASEDILSSSPSPRDESEDNPSDERHNNAHSARPKSKKNKLNRRSMEIQPPSENSSEDDNKNVQVRGTLLTGAYCSISIHSSESEEKGKEDERAKEKCNQMLSRGVIPDLLEGATFNNEFQIADAEKRQIKPNNISTKSMSESMELRRGALMIAAELEEGADDCTHSSTSFDLENMKPPSYMGEMSMTSSGLSDLLSNGNGCHVNGKAIIDRRRSIKRSKKLGASRRFVLKTVRQNLAASDDGHKTSVNTEKSLSASGSGDNLSMKSSGTSDLIDNMNPPSILDDISMTNSCTSLNSISSDILESRSQSLADPRSNSEMFQRLNAAAAMVQVYSREFNNIMTGSMKSSCNSDCLDLVKPPSIFQDIAEVTVEDGTEVVTDPLISDSELEEELPHDDEASVPSTETVHSSLALRKPVGDSTENLNSSIDGDSLSLLDRRHPSVRPISNLAIERGNETNAMSSPVQYSSFTMNNEQVSLTIHNNLDDDKSSSDHSDREAQPMASTVRRGPRIVKPINRETVRQMQEKKNAEKNVRTIRGKGAVNKSVNLLHQIDNTKYSNKSNLNKAPPPVTSVRPTRTSALRASQSKQTNSRLGNGRASPRSFLSKPPSMVTRNASRVNRQTSFMKPVDTSLDSKLNTDQEVKRPQPLLKQGTFIKEETSSKVPDVLPEDAQGRQALPCDDQNNNEKVAGDSTSSPVGENAKVTFKKLSNASLQNQNLQKKFSIPLQKKNECRSGIPLSPSSQSLFQQDKVGRKEVDKKMQNNSIAGRVANTSTSSRTASVNSLSSLSSSGLSVKKSLSQKEVPSKISSIWKCSESSSSANSPVTDCSNAEKNIASGIQNKNLISTSVTIRSNSVTLPSATKNSIPRSSTYEKMPKTNVSVNKTKQPNTRGPAGAPNSTQDSAKTRQANTALNKNINKQKSTAMTTPKPTGRARIVKPVTPRSVVTSKTLKQSNYVSQFSSSRGTVCSVTPTFISSGRCYNDTQDSKASIPLVTAPFAFTLRNDSEKSNEAKTRNSKFDVQDMSGNRSSSDDSDKEGM